LNRFIRVFLLFYFGTISIVPAQGTKNQSLPRISAHRGNTGLAPENTLATIKNALKLHVNLIEIDVRTTADGELIILHDGTLNRTTTGEGAVKNILFADLKKLSAGKGFSRFENEKIPSLAEVCQLISRWNSWHRQKTYLYVDCKEVAPKPLVEMLQKYNQATESCFYGNDAFLQALKQTFPEARLMPGLRKIEDIASKMKVLQPYAFDANFSSLTPAMVHEIHAAGIRVFVDLLGPLDTDTNYQQAISLGVDLIQTDKPALVLKALHH
jgi:glycerophosphoryl diester phosphodiesterase